MKINNPLLPFLLQSTKHDKVNTLRLSVLLTDTQQQLFLKLPTDRRWIVSLDGGANYDLYSGVFNNVQIIKSNTLREFVLHLYSLSILRIERFNVNTPQEFIYFYYNDVFKVNYQSKLSIFTSNNIVTTQTYSKSKITFLTLDTIIPLGKYKGTTVKEVVISDKKYIQWFLSYWAQELKNSYDPIINTFLGKVKVKTKKQSIVKIQKTYIPYVRGYSRDYITR